MKANTPLPHSDLAISVDQLLANALDGVFLINRNRRCVLFNEAMERITGFQGSEIADAECPCFEVLGCRDEHGRPLSNALCPTKSLFEGTRQSARQRLLIRRKNGSQCWIETIYTTVANGSSEPAYVLAVVRDITEAKAKEHELRQEIAAMARQVQARSVEDRGSHPPVSSMRPVAPDSACSSAEVDGGPAGCCSDASGQRDAERGDCEARESATYRLDPLMADFERRAILRALKAAGWQRNKAAQLMGISRSRLYRRMEALKIDLRKLN